MKRIVIITILVFFSHRIMADTSIDTYEPPLLVTLQDNSKVKLSSCADYIKIRKSGEYIKELPDLPNYFYNDLKMDLVNCYVNAVVLQNGLIESNMPTPSLSEILHHLPATEKLIASDDEESNIRKKFKGKSVWDTSPDFVESDDSIVSKNNDEGYRLIHYISYMTKEGNEMDLMTIASFVLHGTYGYSTSYFITSKKGSIWDVVPITINSPL